MNGDPFNSPEEQEIDKLKAVFNKYDKNVIDNYR